MSKYGEVNDLVDKIKMFSNLRIQAYESGMTGNGSFRQESDDLLEQIEKELDNSVTDRIISKHELIHRTQAILLNAGPEHVGE